MPPWGENASASGVDLQTGGHGASGAVHSLHTLCSLGLPVLTACEGKAVITRPWFLEASESLDHLFV